MRGKLLFTKVSLALNVMKLMKRLSLRESSRPGAGERAEIPLSAGYAATSPQGEA